MTTHDRDKVIDAARKVFADINMHGPDETTDSVSMNPYQLAQFYAIAFEDGRQAEREACVKLCESYSYRMDAGIGHLITAIRKRNTK